ncbi:Tetratricopeptide repeat protein 37 [Desmophyllum pertusum]|uniref:Tetratricopeptide repeat protein 37 n=1 Tax=Desmophyllum pertusum TaxID=174260 RepID=A0A9X0CQL9_9CNID|nr:Tetratricopeptide repeat protein 37 [Desmophyllum pertusum]
MATKEMKSALKNARECIKNKDYKEALKHCKTVLKADKTNYTALVFFGKCASELDQPDQAHMAYKKAIESDDTQLLAWQGLAALCEKVDNPQLKTELPDVYIKLLHLYESEKIKWIEIATKLAEFHENQGEVIKAAERWEEIAMATENTTEQLDIWSRIIRILEKRSLEEYGVKKLQEAYEKVVHGSQSQEPSKQLEIHFENYLRFLVKHQVSEDDELYKDQRQKICDEAKSMTKLFPTSTFALEVLGKDFVQSLITAPTPEMGKCVSKTVPHAAWVWNRLGWTRECSASSERVCNGKGITTERSVFMTTKELRKVQRKAVERWEEIAMATENTTEQLDIWSRIIRILEKRSLEEYGVKKLQEAYEKVVHGSQAQEPSKQLEIHFENYLRFLVRHQVSEDDELYKDQRQKICDEAKSMTKLFPTSTFALEVLGKDFVQSLITAPGHYGPHQRGRLSHFKDHVFPWLPAIIYISGENSVEHNGSVVFLWEIAKCMQGVCKSTVLEAYWYIFSE